MPDIALQPDGGESNAEAAAVAAAKEQAKGLAAVLAAGFKREGIDQPLATDAAGTAAVEGDATATATEVVEPITAEELTEVEGMLDELGIDLGIRSADVTPEMRPAYEALVQSAVALAEDTLNRQMQASEGRMQFDQFKNNLEKSPDRLLLSLAMSHPELITQTASLVSQMQENPQVKEAVLRELEVELKLQEANRKEQLMNEREKRMKAQQVISATRRASREAGVSYDLAEKFVAMAIQANGGDLDPSEVREIIESIKPKVAPTRPKVVSPAAAAAARTAPNSTVAGAQASAAAPISPGLKDGERKHSGGGFRNIVREAMARVTGSGQ